MCINLSSRTVKKFQQHAGIIRTLTRVGKVADSFKVQILWLLVIFAAAKTAIPAPALGPLSKAIDTKTTESKSAEPPYHFFQPLIWGPDCEWKLQAGGESRLRLENRRNFDQNKKIGDNDNVGFFRTRLNYDLTWRSCVRGYFEVIDSRTWNQRVD